MIVFYQFFLNSEGDRLPKLIDDVLAKVKNIGFEESDVFAAIKLTKSLDVKTVVKRLSNQGI